MKLSRSSPGLNVYINGVLSNYLRPLVVHRSCGSRNLDYAVVQDDLSLRNRHLQNLAIQSAINNEIEITGILDGQVFIYFWGKESRSEINIDENQEAATRTYRVEPWHFGRPLYGRLIYDPQSRQHFDTSEEILFNPIIDGKIYGNKRTTNPFTRKRIPVFQDPETARVDAAFYYQGSRPEQWTLAEVVFYLCEAANNTERYITNPTLAELNLLFTNADLVRHLKIHNGMYLPQILDRVLDPFGYEWFVQLLGRGRRKITIFKRGKGRRDMQVGLQHPDSFVKPGPKAGIYGSNLVAANIQYDVSELYNEVVGQGSFLEMEGTFELFRGWPAKSDALANTPELLREGTEDFETRKDVWRKWVLNESGDYNRLRPEITKPYDFGRVLSLDANQWSPKRRRFLPTLTIDYDATPAGKAEGTHIEYLDATYGENTWKTLVGASCKVLNNECGIYFDGDNHPETISKFGNAARIRVTATVRFDQRLTYRAVRQNTSSQADKAVLYLDLRDRFHYSYVTSASIFYTDYVNGTRKANVSADDGSLQAYVTQIRDAWDLAAVNGPLAIEGIDWSYELGDSITEIRGRNISLNAKPANVGKFYPQVVGVVTDFQRQRITLHMEQFRNEKRFAIDRQGMEGEFI